MILYLAEKITKFHKKLLETISNFSQEATSTKTNLTTQYFLFPLSSTPGNMSWPHSHPRPQNLGINLNKEVKDLYDEDFKSLKTEIGTKKWKDKPCSWISKINIVEIIILTRQLTDSMQSQSNTLWEFFFYKTIKNSILNMELRKTPNCQKYLSKLKNAGGIAVPNFKILQCYSNKTIWYW